MRKLLFPGKEGKEIYLIESMDVLGVGLKGNKLYEPNINYVNGFIGIYPDVYYRGLSEDHIGHEAFFPALEGDTITEQNEADVLRIAAVSYLRGHQYLNSMGNNDKPYKLVLLYIRIIVCTSCVYKYILLI
jgi:hypothetical protein